MSAWISPASLLRAGATASATVLASFALTTGSAQSAPHVANTRGDARTHQPSGSPVAVREGASARRAAAPATGVSAQPATDVLFAAALRDLTPSTELAREMVAQRLLAAVYERHPSLSSDIAEQIVTTLRSDWNARISVDPKPNVISAGILVDSLREHLPEPARASVDVVLATMRKLVDDQHAEDIAANDLLGFARDSGNPDIAALVSGTVERVRAIARGNATFANAWNRFFAPPRLYVLADKPAILDAAPTLRANATLLAQILDRDGALTASLDQLEQLAGGIQDKINEATMETILPGEEGGVPTSTVEKLETGLTIVTQLLSKLGAEKLAGQIERAGSTAITVYRGVVALKGLLAGAGGGAAAGLAVAGAVVGVAAAVVVIGGYIAHVVGSAVKKQLAALSQQIKQLEALVNTVLQRVDALTELVKKGFHELNLAVTALLDGQRDAQLRLVALTDLVDRTRGELADIVATGFARELSNAIDQYLGFEERTARPLPVGDFDRAESVFYVWATQHANDDVSIGPADLGTGDGQIASNFAAYPTGALTYLSKVMARFGLGFMEDRAPATRLYLKAARAYAQLLAENPEPARSIDPSRRLRVLQVGESLQADFANVRKSAMVDRIAQHHVERVSELEQAIASKEDPFLNVAGPEEGAGVSGFPPSQARRCADNAFVSGGVPAHTDSHDFLPQPYRLLAALTDKAVRACVDPTLVNVEKGSTRCGSGNQHKIWKWRLQARWLMMVQLEDGSWRTIRARTATSGYRQNCQTVNDTNGELEALWGGLVGPISTAPIEVMDSGLLESVSSRARDLLRARKVASYGRIATGLRDGDLQARSIALNGSAALMRYTASLGFPIATSTNPKLREVLDAVDIEPVIRAFAEAASSPPARNMRAGTIAALRAHGAEWKASLNGLIGEIASGKTREATPLLETTLSRLRATTWIIALAPVSEAPGGGEPEPGPVIGDPVQGPTTPGTGQGVTTGGAGGGAPGGGPGPGSAGGGAGGGPGPGGGGGVVVAIAQPNPANVKATWRRTRHGARIVALSVRKVPRGAKITVRCTGQKQCPVKTIRRERRSFATIELGKGVRGKALKAGATLSVAIEAPGTVTKRVAYRVRRGDMPKRTARCTMPGTAKAAKCS